MMTPGGASTGAPSGLVRIRKSDGTYAVITPAVVRVVGPASYATGGFQVDCSAFFSSIVAAVPTRAYVTATLAPPAVGRSIYISESGTDLFSAAKFLAQAFRSPVHTHTYDKTNTPTGGPSGAPTGLGADNNHTHTLAYTSTASGQPSNTVFNQETAGATGMDSNTYEFLIWGIPL